MINTQKHRSSEEHIDLSDNMLGSLDERTSKKISARRKIDNHIEKKRLREELFYIKFDDD